jgi:hypothetical protein
MHASERNVVGLSCQPLPWPEKHNSRRVVLQAYYDGHISGTVKIECYYCSSPSIHFVDSENDMNGKDGGLQV